MSSPPSNQTLSREDFAEQAGWIDRLLRPLNTFIGQTSAFLGQSLELQGHVLYFEDVFTTEATVANSWPRYFTVPKTPRSVSVAQAEDVTGGVAFAASVFPTWSAANLDGQTKVKISSVAGLPTGSNKYRIRYEVKF